jgi:hypothetical protein
MRPWSRPSDENQTARDKCAEDRAALKTITQALQKLQNQLADMAQQQRAQNLALLRLEQGRAAPRLGGLGLLPSPSTTANAGDMTALSDPSEHALRLYKIDFPTFDGASDPRPWFTHCNMFFLGQRTQDSDKTWLASYHLTNAAALWYGHLEAKLGQRPSWGEFQTLISNHFGPPTRANPFGELISTRHSGTVADYSKRFLENLAHVQPISDAEECDIFTNSLGFLYPVDVILAHGSPRGVVRPGLAWPACLFTCVQLQGPPRQPPGLIHRRFHRAPGTAVAACP